MMAYNSIYSQTHNALFLAFHWGLHASPATSYFPPIRFNDQKTKIPALQKWDEFSLGFEIIYPRDMPRTETVAKLTKKHTTLVSETGLAILINILLIKTNTIAILGLKTEK